MKAPIPDDCPEGGAIMGNRNIYAKMESAIDVNIQPHFGLDQFLTKFPADYSQRCIALPEQELFFKPLRNC